MRNAHPASSLALAAALAACTVGPDYKAPDTTMPARFAGTAAPGAGASDLARWWTGFDDPALSGLVVRALHDNLDLQTAASRIREAREQELMAGAAAWPTVTAGPQFTHTTLSANSVSLGGLGSLTGGAAGNSSLSGLGLPGLTFNTFQLGLTASWEPDLFGKTRRSVGAAHDAMEATVWNGRDTQVALVAEVADAYLALRAAQRRLAIAERDLARQRGLLDLLRARASSGLANELDVRQQQTEVAATQA